MDDQKPNFKDKALSHIPFDIIQSMEKQVVITDADMQALDKVVKEKGPALHSIVPGRNMALPSMTPASPVPTANIQPVTMSYAIDGHVITVPLDDAGAAITLFYTLLAFVWGKDKKVAKILKQFNFKFFDANKVQIYPPVKNAKR